MLSRSSADFHAVFVFVSSVVTDFCSDLSSFSFPVLKVTRAVKASMPCTPIAVYLEGSHEWRRQNFGDSKTYFKMFKGKK